MRRAAPGMLVLLLGLAACGGPEVPHHGLRAGPLESRPQGEEHRIGQGPPLGRWTATLETTWRRRKDDGGEDLGRAVIRLLQDTRREDDARSVSRLKVRVDEPEGIAHELVRRLDGVSIRFERDARGRPVPGSRRFEVAGPPGADVFFDGLMFAGFGTGRPWVPDRPVRVGEAWPRAALGLDARTLETWGLSGGALETSGAAKLEALQGGVAQVEIDALSEVSGLVHLQGAPSRAVSFGVHTRGEAALDASSGQPRAWRSHTTIHYLGDDGTGLKRIWLEEVVVATVRPQGRAPGGGD